MILFFFIHSVCFGAIGGKKLYETFYVGGDGEQYFIKPLQFKASNSREEIWLDFVFRHKENTDHQATINYSLTGTQIIKSVDSLLICSGEKFLVCKKNEFMFTEKKKKTISSRFTAPTTTSFLVKIFNAFDWKITIYRKGEEFVYKPTGKTAKSLKKLENSLFSLLKAE